MTDTKTRQTECLGIWANPDTTLTGSITESMPVKKMKSMMEGLVIDQVNDYHALEPKLTRRDVSSTIYPDAQMGVDLLTLNKFITVVQPKAVAQERFSTADTWKAIKKLQRDLAEETGSRLKLQHDLAEETGSRLKDQEEHGNAMTKLAKRLKEEMSQRGDLEALQLEVKQLEQRLEEERQEREELEEMSKQNLKQQEGKIKKLKAELKVANDRIELLQRQLRPIQLRALLDHSREDILKYFKTQTWEDLEVESGAHLVDIIMKKLEEDEGIKDYRPSRKAIEYLCSPNDVRKGGNYYAHKAVSDEIKSAIKKRNKKRPVLIELYQFVYKTMYN